MRDDVEVKLQHGRIRDGYYASDNSYGLMGAFVIQGPCGALLRILSSGHDTESGWEHVSVSTQTFRPPNWEEMCYIKNLFWGEEECVVQFHPPKSEYVNCHPGCLHLWKCIAQPFPRPEPSTVGVLS